MEYKSMDLTVEGSKVSEAPTPTSSRCGGNVFLRI